LKIYTDGIGVGAKHLRLDIEIFTAQINTQNLERARKFSSKLSAD